jgi:hypothetical protein
MDEKKIVVKVPPQGSLGLLALGHKGLIAWRKAREEAKDKEVNTESEPEK